MNSIVKKNKYIVFIAVAFIVQLVLFSCSKSIKESDHENHNCYEDFCKTDYYPSPSTVTNCFKEEEKKLNWFLNTTIKR